ncbi:FliH/SctL family protein [Clostridium grantii]|uniref:Flagellar biosynthesis/type III secretory pathway protein FliH n=1 Tax=Clostridium grantii DSM 8605 TaxID=1121316 RepID=A0A1M5W823_9CLOT|nr:FliH/SctL family protein [Clostridium grantii]SHH83611.1 Flagellar biosynthesis/type III secretory pathway protein FliH [Clostridium grantii DSM 8605]
MTLYNNVIKKEQIDNRIIRKFHVENFDLNKENHHQENLTYIDTNDLMDEIYEKEKQILDEALIQAETIKSEAEQEGYTTGFNTGNEEGYKEGYKKALEEIQIEKKEATKLIIEAQKIKNEIIGSMEAEVINLVTSISEKITRIAVYNNDEKIIPMIKNALSDINNRERIIIRVNPINIQLLKNKEDDFLKICPAAIFTFLEDNSLNELDCILDSENEVLDLNIENQIKNIILAFQEKR